jgi:hypothetical protein
LGRGTRLDAGEEVAGIREKAVRMTLGVCLVQPSFVELRRLSLDWE